MNILYLSIGTNLYINAQIHFSIQSLWAFHQNVKVHVVTDHPELFMQLSQHAAIVIHEINKDTLDAWTNADALDHFFRAKLKSIEKVVKEDPNTPCLYLDSDTFIFAPLDNLFNALCDGKAIMHEPERKYSDLQTKTDRVTWRAVGEKTIAGVAITKGQMGWNAGVLGLPANSSAVLEHTLEICDELCVRLNKRRYFSEQMANSLALSHHYELIKANDCIGHYWGNKEEWNAAIIKFYMEAKMKGLSFEQEQELIRNFDFSAIPFRRKASNTRERLEKLIGKMFPDKDYLYVKNSK